MIVCSNHVLKKPPGGSKKVRNRSRKRLMYQLFLREEMNLGFVSWESTRIVIRVIGGQLRTLESQHTSSVLAWNPSKLSLGARFCHHDSEGNMVWKDPKTKQFSNGPDEFSVRYPGIYSSSNTRETRVLNQNV